MFVTLVQKLRRSLGYAAPHDAVTDSPDPKQEEKIDFEAVLRAASDHHSELSHGCQLTRPPDMCTRCFLAAAREVQRLDPGSLSTQQRQEVLTLAFVHSDALTHLCEFAGGGTCTRCAVEGLGTSSPAPRTSMDAMLRRWGQECPPKEKMFHQKSLVRGPATQFSPIVAAVVWLFTSATNLFQAPAMGRHTSPAEQLPVLSASQPSSDPTQMPFKPLSRVPFPLPLPYSAWYPVSVPRPLLPVLLPPVPPRSLSLSPPLPLPSSVASALQNQEQAGSSLVEVPLRQAIVERDNIPHTCEPHLEDSTCVRCLLASLAPLLGLP